MVDKGKRRSRGVINQKNWELNYDAFGGEELFLILVSHLTNEFRPRNLFGEIQKIRYGELIINIFRGFWVEIVKRVFFGGRKFFIKNTLVELFVIFMNWKNIFLTSFAAEV